jgi:hypothetical protein
VNLADGCQLGQTIHEIGHVIGLWHEQSREDRDSFVTIQWANIEPGKEHNFNQHISDGDDVGAYDYGSIMHYGRTAFSRNGQDTIVPINPAGAAIGQRTALSAGDIAAANSFCRGGVIGTFKEPVQDVTIKERIKDLAADTRKEIIRDTVKELVHDKRFDPIDPFGPVKFDQVGPLVGGGRVLPGGTTLARGGALPFAMATAHQAPGAAARGAGDQNAQQQQVTDTAIQLDQQLQMIADALAQAQANVQQLQQQYDETQALLQQLLDQQGRS